MGIQEAPGWLDVAAALSLFDRTMGTAWTAYRRFVAEGSHQPSPWKDLRGQIFLGGSDFRERCPTKRSHLNLPLSFRANYNSALMT